MAEPEYRTVHEALSTRISISAEVAEREADRIALAAGAAAQYIPLDPLQDALLDSALRSYTSARGLDITTVRLLRDLQIPILSGIDADLAAAIHQEESFVEWRVALRSMLLEARELPVSDGARLVSEELHYRAEVIEQAVSRSNVLKKAVTGEARRVGVEVPVWAAASTLGAPGKLMAGTRFASSVASVLSEVIQAKPSGENAIVLRLTKGS